MEATLFYNIYQTEQVLREEISIRNNPRMIRSNFYDAGDPILEHEEDILTFLL